MSDSISKEEINYLETQESNLKDIIRTIRETPRAQSADLREIQNNITTLKEDIKVGKEDDLGGLFYQLNIQYSLAQKFAKGSPLPNSSSPYFGHMKLQEGSKIKDIYLGHVSYLHRGSNLKIVDWKSAPISRVFYGYEEGEEFELELPHNVLEGNILERSILTIENERLVRVDRNGLSYTKSSDGWENLNSSPFSLQGGEGSATREIVLGTGQSGKSGPEVISLLDPTQYELLNRPADKPLLIIGGAGSGKTTVALYRIAHLCQKNKISPHNILVIVPNKGLITLSKTLLNKIGLHRVKVETTDGWIKSQVLKLVADLPKKIAEHTPLSVSLIKRHQAFMLILEEYVSNKRIRLIQKIQKEIPLDSIHREIQRGSRKSLDHLFKIFLTIRDLSSLQKITIKDSLKEINDVRSDLLKVCSDKNLLHKLIALSNGTLTERMIQNLFLHTSYQMKINYSEDYSGRTLDGRSVNDGSNSELAQTIDQEDYSLYLKLIELQNGRLQTNRGSVNRYQHIVLDEAQELSPIELNIFGQSLYENGNITVAGDAAQQIDDAISFSGWDTVLSHLGLEGAEKSELEISYRSPQGIIELAHHVLGDLAPEKMPKSKKIGAPVQITPIQHRAHGSMILNDHLSDLLNREPSASVAIICQTMKTAEDFYFELKDLGKVRMIYDSEFSFSSGIDVTTVDQIRGLEFDYVIIPDADKVNYPDNPRARKRMHLATTRAIHQLWILTSPDKSPLLP